MRLCRLRLTCAVLAGALLVPGLAAGLPRKGAPAPPFQVTSTSGQRITNATYGGSVLLVEFFATWCAPCRESVASLVRLARTYGKQGFHVLGLSIDTGGERVVRSFVRDKKVSYPVALASDALQEAYGVRSVPTMFLVDRKGRIVERFMGVSEETEREMAAAIRKALAER